mgnify:FL=1
MLFRSESRRARVRRSKDPELPGGVVRGCKRVAMSLKRLLRRRFTVDLPRSLCSLKRWQEMAGLQADVLLSSLLKLFSCLAATPTSPKLTFEVVCLLQPARFVCNEPFILLHPTFCLSRNVPHIGRGAPDPWTYLSVPGTGCPSSSSSDWVSGSRTLRRKRDAINPQMATHMPTMTMTRYRINVSGRMGAIGGASRTWVSS